MGPEEQRDRCPELVPFLPRYGSKRRTQGALTRTPSGLVLQTLARLRRTPSCQMLQQAMGARSWIRTNIHLLAGGLPIELPRRVRRVPHRRRAAKVPYPVVNKTSPRGGLGGKGLDSNQRPGPTTALALTTELPLLGSVSSDVKPARAPEALSGGFPVGAYGFASPYTFSSFRAVDSFRTRRSYWLIPRGESC